MPPGPAPPEKLGRVACGTVTPSCSAATRWRGISEGPGHRLKSRGGSRCARARVDLTGRSDRCGRTDPRNATDASVASSPQARRTSRERWAAQRRGGERRHAWNGRPWDRVLTMCCIKVRSSIPPCGPAILPRPTPNLDVVFTTRRKIARPGSADKAQVIGFSTHGDPTIGPAWFARTVKKICPQTAHALIGLGDESWTAQRPFIAKRAPPRSSSTLAQAINRTCIGARDIRAVARRIENPFQVRGRVRR